MQNIRRSNWLKRAASVFWFLKRLTFSEFPRQMLPIWWAQIAGKGGRSAIPRTDLAATFPGRKVRSHQRLNSLQNSGPSSSKNLETEDQENCSINIVSKITPTIHQSASIESKFRYSTVWITGNSRFFQVQILRPDLFPVKEKEKAHFYPAIPKAIRIHIRIKAFRRSPLFGFQSLAPYSTKKGMDTPKIKMKERENKI